MRIRVSASQWITLISVAVALTSLYVARQSLRSQERSIALSKQQLAEARAPVWLASIDRDRSVVIFERRTGECILLIESVALVYATPFGAAATEALAPTFSASLRQILAGIRDFLNITRQTAHEGKGAVFIQLHVPLLASSQYACGGARHTDTAVYMLQVSGLMVKDRKDWPIGVEGLSFYERLSGKSEDLYSEKAKSLVENIARFGELRGR